MVKHVVMYSLVNPSEENKIALRDKFLSMKGKIDILLDIESGIDYLKSGRSYDVVLICTFKSKEDLGTYAMHPVHLPILAYAKTLVKESHAVDFEY